MRRLDWISLQGTPRGPTVGAVAQGSEFCSWVCVKHTWMMVPGGRGALSLSPLRARKLASTDARSAGMPPSQRSPQICSHPPAAARADVMGAAPRGEEGDAALKRWLRNSRLCKSEVVGGFLHMYVPSVDGSPRPSRNSPILTRTDNEIRRSHH